MTKIFENYSAFLRRDDKKENGVSQSFADLHPKWEEGNVDNEGCWNCSDCSGCSGCSDCSDCYGCSGCSGCSRCSGCSGCSDCSDCYGCSRCSGCSWKRNLKGENAASTSGDQELLGFPNVPVIENIHQKIYEAVSKPDALNMGDWHTCDTTHCRGGWVVHLAGKGGYDLARKTDTLFAAMQIYKASSPIRVFPPRFFESNEVALADMKRCAEEEGALVK